jgi:nicotinamidase-related amidase
MNKHNRFTKGFSAALLLLATVASPTRAREPRLAAGRLTPTTLRALYGLAAPRRLSAARTALLLVDFQEEYFHGALPLPSGARAASTAGDLLAWARAHGVSVIHVQNIVANPNSPVFAPGSAGAKIIAALTPTAAEHVISKASGGAFTHTELQPLLQDTGIDTIIVAGLMTHLAVSLTAADGTLLGYRVIVAGDATASRDLPSASGARVISHEVVHQAALAALADRFADVMTAGAIRALPLDP